jgi:DNA-binding transcriptional ArsR family regulator
VSEAGGKVQPKRTLDGQPTLAGTPEEHLKALNHPVRRKILRRLHALDEARSPKELGKELGIALNCITYHVKMLEGFHAVALTDPRPVRGVEEHFYASTVRNEVLVSIWLDWTASGDKGP